jgi:hypothetical protein
LAHQRQLLKRGYEFFGLGKEIPAGGSGKRAASQHFGKKEIEFDFVTPNRDIERINY